MRKAKENKMYIDIAERVAQRSYSQRLQVGCVIEKNGSIISFGWNGMPAGYDNCCEHEEDIGFGDTMLVTNKEVQHAEMNAIGKAARSGISTENATLYITHSPCMNCALLINIAGISEVYYKHQYRDTSGIDFLKKNGITINMINDKGEIICE